MQSLNAMESFCLHGRRHFVGRGALALLALNLTGQERTSDPNVFGPRPGYSPQIGTLVSEMAWMRDAVLGTVKALKEEQLDFLLDNSANRIGALLLHLAATERLYQLNTFDNVRVQDLEHNADFKEWGVAMDLGEPARQGVKGHGLDYYLDRLHQVRQRTLSEFRKRDDSWLMAIDRTWGWGPTNNLCKWFHVCEHESHHAGQMAMLKSRAPVPKHR
jgi:uncharacterized damage-inducible protein DinB